MILLNIFDVKDMMAALLLSESFDGYLLEEVSVTTFAKLEIKGRRNKEWYDSGEANDLPELLYWKEVKPVIFSYIKGKKTPHSFVISLKLTESFARTILGEQLAVQMIDGAGLKLLLHFRFEKGKLSVVTGTSYETFVMDKRADFAWDSGVKKLLGQMKIAFEEV